MRLQLQQVSKRFLTLRGRIEAIQDVDLTVESGEFFVLLGPSGCGKSTLLNLIAGLERPSGGEIRFDEDLVAAPEKRVFRSARERNVAMVFQTYALYPHLSVFENIAFPLRIRREKGEAVHREVQQAAAALEIKDLLAARPKELSGGQRQRVAIARAVVRQPNLFLLDEPLSNLDARLRTATRLELKRLQRRLGITTIYVTHDQIEAMTLGDRVAVLRRGRLEQVGTPAELYEQPASAFVAAFIGSPPMNILPAAWAPAGDNLHIMLDGIRLEMPATGGWRLAGRPPGACLLGLRPEDLQLQPIGHSGLNGVVEVVEPLGREDLLHVRAAGREWLLLSSERGWRPGQAVVIYPDLRRAHLFPATEGERKSFSTG